MTLAHVELIILFETRAMEGRMRRNHKAGLSEMRLFRGKVGSEFKFRGDNKNKGKERSKKPASILRTLAQH